MPSLRDRQFFVKEYSSSTDFAPEGDAAYISGDSAEPRASHPGLWAGPGTGLASMVVTNLSEYTFTAQFGSSSAVYSLRSAANLKAFWRSLGNRITYLDVTGIPHRIWAPLLRSGLKESNELRVVYVEPDHYKFSAAPTEGDIFDLSDKISGVAPLPGFATFSDLSEENSCFVPLLGFEGIRLAHILESVQPAGGKVVPVVGLPGFKVEYPFHSFHGNCRSLVESRCWRNVKFACGNNPFSLFFALDDISAANPQDQLKIALIGTKPHAVGAVLFALASPERVELIYDHPMLKADRTVGTGKVFVYDVSTFMRN